VTASEIVRKVRESGGDVGLLPDGRVALLRRSRIPDTLAALARDRVADLRAFVAEMRPGSASDAVLSAMRLLRDCRFPPEPPVCAFFCGHPHERCHRCGASCPQHYGVGP
jgi:hypothetical protein